MFNIYDATQRPAESLFFRKNDENDTRLGEVVSRAIAGYENCDIVILGCSQDEGVRRNGGRTGAALAPDKIREQFYKLTNFGINLKIFDLGNTKIAGSLEEIHENHTKIAGKILKDGKTLITLGGGNDLSYADGAAMTQAFGSKNWAGFNIDAHFDVRAERVRNSGTPYRQLLESGFICPANFYEIGYQEQVNSTVYYNYLQEAGVNLTSLAEIQEVGVRNFFKNILQKIERDFLFFGFDVDVVRSADAPGVSAANPLGLTAQEFCEAALLAGNDRRTKIIEFTEVNPLFDIDNQTAKLTATAMYKFCLAKSRKK